MNFFLRALIGVVFFFALMVIVPYLIGLAGLSVPDNIVRVCLAMAVLAFIVWGPAVA